MIELFPELVRVIAVDTIDIDFDDSMGVKIATILCLDRSGRVYLKERTARVMSSFWSGIGWRWMPSAVRPPTSL